MLRCLLIIIAFVTTKENQKMKLGGKMVLNSETKKLRDTHERQISNKGNCFWKTSAGLKVGVKPPPATR